MQTTIYIPHIDASHINTSHTDASHTDASHTDASHTDARGDNIEPDALIAATPQIASFAIKHADDTTKRSFVYFLLSSDDTSTSFYIGATFNVDTRLRQHNGLISGGAKRTKRVLTRGSSWVRVCYVSGFPTWRTALQFESRWQRLTAKERRISNIKKIKKNHKPIEWGLRALHILLSLDKASAPSFLYSEWNMRGGTDPVVHFESDWNTYNSFTK